MKSKTVWEVLSTTKHPEQTKYLPFTKADPSVCRDCILVGLISLCNVYNTATLRHCWPSGVSLLLSTTLLVAGPKTTDGTHLWRPGWTVLHCTGALLYTVPTLHPSLLYISSPGSQNIAKAANWEKKKIESRTTAVTAFQWGNLVKVVRSPEEWSVKRFALLILTFYSEIWLS